MRVKICGITTPDDARAAVSAGADAIGLNFVGGPRRIGPDQAAEMLARVAPFVVPVALVRADAEGLSSSTRSFLTGLGIFDVQVYGCLTARGLAELREGGWRVMPVVAVRDAHFAEQMTADREQGSLLTRASAVVLDAYDPDREGGTGRAFCWEWVQTAREEGRLDGWPSIVLAGGLHPENVAEAVRVVRPYAVDVSSGVEVDGVPGRKDVEKMRRFVRNARHAAAAE